MRLAAVYLPDNVLPHIFGEGHKCLTLNFGGLFSYEFLSKNNSVSLINKKANTFFVENFWGEGITLMSSIVGANGSGKTTLLKRLLIDELSPDLKQRGCIFIYENGGSTFLLNETGLDLEKSADFELIDPKEKQEVLKEKILYYSPNLDYDLKKLNSPIGLANYHNSNLANYNLRSIKRHLFFLNNADLINTLKIYYEDFPYYEELEFKATALYKSDFEKVYIQSTIGNKLYRIRNRLLQRADDNERSSGSNNVTLNQDEIKEFFDTNSTIQDELKELWSVYENTNPQKSQYLHDNSNFFRDIEVNLFSYLVIKDTFPLDGDTGEYSFLLILESENFVERLTHFLKKYIIQQSELFYRMIISRDVEISLDNLDHLKNLVNEFSELNQSFLQVTFENKATRVLNRIELIENVYNLYTILRWFSEENTTTPIEGGFKINVTNTDLEKFNDFITIYETLILQIKDGSLDSVLDITSTKKLSTGEKSIIDLYASIYDYLKRYGEMDHMYKENYILLLDEPEQGYHPIWKKKFVQAITSTIKPLFSVNQKAQGVQILFTTHDPLTLSDIHNSNITYLNKNEAGFTFIDSKNSRRSFGANVHDLLADSFFLEDGFMGEFAQDWITDLIDYLTSGSEQDGGNNNKLPKREWSETLAKQVIHIVDEPLIKERLQSLFDEKFIHPDKSRIEARIVELQNILKNQANEES